MKILNKTETTLIFSDINLVLLYDKEGIGVEVDDVDIQSSNSLKQYITNGKVEIIKPNENNVVYRGIKNRPMLIDRAAKKKEDEEAEEKREEKHENIIGGESKVMSDSVHYHSDVSSIQKFKDTGIMDINYFGPCFSEDTIIICQDSVKFIKDVKIGDMVLTHLGNWKKVTNTFKTEYNNNVLNLQPYLLNNIYTKCTPNHPFYTNDFGDFFFKEASKIEIKDYLLFPKFSFVEQKKFLLLSEYIDVNFQEEQNGFKTAIKIEEDFMDIIIFYLLYGKISGSEVQFKIPKGMFDFFDRTIDKIFGIKASGAESLPTYVKISYRSKSLILFFNYFCGLERKLPFFIFSDANSTMFLKSLFKNKLLNSKGGITIYSKHPLVIWGIRLLLLLNKTFSSIHYISTRELYCLNIIMKDVDILLEKQILTKEQVSKHRDKAFTFKFIDNYLYIPVYKNEKGEVVKFVYNLEVEDDSSYTANFCAVHNCYDAGGYAKMNRKYIDGLSKKENINLRLENISSRRDIDSDIANKLDSFLEVPCGEDAIRIHGCTAPVFRWGGPKVLYTMMETEKIHPQYVERCNMANEVWLPSKWCISKFKECGVVSPIHYIPIGVDFDIYKEGQRSLDFGGKNRGFTFISVFGWSLRKCYDIMIRAFVEEFSSKDDVTYLICSRYAGGTEEVRKDVCRNEIKRITNSYKKINPPNILYFGDVMPEKLMGSLYNSANCYVGLSRGEGFGLPWLESSMCGLPVIASRYSGLTDFLTDENSFLVDPSGIKVQKDVEWISYFYKDMPMADYDVKSVEQTRAHMRYVYENYAKAKEKNKILQKFIIENYNWEKCIDMMYDRIVKIYPNMKPRGKR